MPALGERQPDREATGATSARSWARTLSLLPRFRVEEWLGIFHGHEIRVVTQGLRRARLYIDGEYRDGQSPLLCWNRAIPLLSGRLPSARSEVTIVYVYAHGVFRVQIAVRVAGQPVPMNLCVGPQAKVRAPPKQVTPGGV